MKKSNLTLNNNGEWRLIDTGKKQERRIPLDNLEIHPQYPYHLFSFDEADFERAIHYIKIEGAPFHRLYVMPNPIKEGYYYIIGWLIVYEAYRRQGFTGEIPTLCYLKPEAQNLFWQNWQYCNGNNYDIK